VYPPRELRPAVVAPLLLLGACAAGRRAVSSASDAAPRTASSVAAPSASAPPDPYSGMARIPEATYRMGSEAGDDDEKPVHAVHVASFYLNVTQVTVAEYASCVSQGACVPAPTTVAWPGIGSADGRLYSGECNGSLPSGQDRAVNCVDWTMADAYCRWAGKRLPTEEEWEYAACGGDCNAALGRGGEPSIVRGAARWPGAGRVARGRPGPFGLYDMASGVWEWTASTYCPYDHPECQDGRRVVRGGSWSVVDDVFVRLADRAASDPSTRNSDVGFRCAR
jgi:formylglycine-generating enzyme required for sulfatase activity